VKKTRPDSARAILNAQPQIAYALITLMVNVNAVDVDVLQVRSPLLVQYITSKVRI
jgi:cleavage stimulation factor subunit 2